MPLSSTDLIKALSVRTCIVPLDPPVQTASGSVPAAPLVLVDLECESGIIGSTYLFTYSPIALKPVADLVRGMEALVKGQPLAPVALSDMLAKRFRLLGTEGLVLMAMAAIDMAAWDALARVNNLPLARLLGGTTASLPAYASMRTMKPVDVANEAEDLLRLGFNAFKFKVGWPDVADDIAAIKSLRAAVGSTAQIMVDFNQSLIVPEAKRRVKILSDLDLTWIEEPTLMADLPGQVEIRRAANTPIQAGENWWGPQDAMKSIAAGATDLMMPDIMKIGGVTGWLRTAALAEAAGLPVSSHIFPEVSAHALAVTPTAHLLEYLDLASPILVDAMRIENGRAHIPASPGSGIAWNAAAVARFAV
jgi:mandelate racemase